MRISKPKNWQWMSKEEKEKWAMETGKQISKAREDFRKFIEKEDKK